MKWNSWLISIVFLLSSCGSPKEHIKIPNYLQSSKESLELSKLSQLRWWQAFQDDDLNQWISQALIYNHDIRVAKRSIQVAQKELLTIKLTWIPSLLALFGYSKSPALGIPGMFYGILPSYYVNFFSLYFQEKTAEFELKKSKAYFQSARLVVIGEVVKSYFSLLAWHQEKKLIDNMIKDYQALISAVSKAKAQGLTDNLELLSLKTKLNQVQGLSQQIENNIVANENALHFLTNQAPGPVCLKSNFNHIPFHAVPFHKISLSLILNRPDLQMAWFDLQASCAGVPLAASKILPSMTIDYFVGKAHPPHLRTTSITPYQDLYSTFNLSPSVFGNMFTKKAYFKKSLEIYNKVLQNSLRNLANAIDLNIKSDNKYIEDSKAFQHQVQRYHLQTKLFEHGLIRRMDLLSDEIKLNQRKFKLTLSKLEQLLSVIHLYEELAAGIGC